MIEVVNKRDYEKSNDSSIHEVYIGRSGRGPFLQNNGSLLQNNYIIGRDGDRLEVIDKYRVDLKKRYNTDIYIRNLLNTLAVISISLTLVLICHCKPLPCHGDVVKECLESIIENGYWKID